MFSASRYYLPSPPHLSYEEQQPEHPLLSKRFTSFSAGMTAELYLLVGLVCIFYVHRIQCIGTVYSQLE